MTLRPPGSGRITRTISVVASISAAMTGGIPVTVKFVGMTTAGTLVTTAVPLVINTGASVTTAEVLVTTKEPLVITGMVLVIIPGVLVTTTEALVVTGIVLVVTKMVLVVTKIILVVIPAADWTVKMAEASLAGAI